METKNFQFMLAREFDSSCLRQGDVIERNARLAEALGSAHAYYASAEDYEYFLVLTPTCHLVKRNGDFSARYITLAAIRPLEIYIDREMRKFKKTIKTFSGDVLKKDKETLAKQLIQRVIHNTQDGYLFLPGEFFPDKKDRMAFLLLSVAMRIKDHYEACLAGKYLQLADSFSAKVGLLTSDLYGQVATEAIEEQADISPGEIFAEYYDRFLYGAKRHWLSEERISRLRVEAQRYRESHGSPVPESGLEAMVLGIPSDGHILAERLLEIAERTELIPKDVPEEKRLHFVNELVGDPIIKRVAHLG